jgi:hypothetical protein
MFSYIFGQNSQAIQETKYIDNPPAIVHVKIPRDYVYAVFDKNSDTILGVFSTLDKAKKEGQKTSYHNSKIIKTKVDGACSYMHTPVYVDK